MDDLIARYDALKIELAELEAVKAEAARLWFEEQQSLSRGERAAMDARIAQLRAERLRLRPQVVALRSKLHQDSGSRLLSALMRQCRAAGQQALIDAARAEARR